MRPVLQDTDGDEKDWVGLGGLASACEGEAGQGDEHPGGGVGERDGGCGDGVEEPGGRAGCHVAAGLDGGQQPERRTAQRVGSQRGDRSGLRGLGGTDPDPGQHEGDREDPDGGGGEREDQVGGQERGDPAGDDQPGPAVTFTESTI